MSHGKTGVVQDFFEKATLDYLVNSKDYIAPRLSKKISENSQHSNRCLVCMNKKYFFVRLAKYIFGEPLNLSN